MNPPRYAVPVDVSLDHDTAVTTVTELLAAQGFGILTTIDIQGTLKKKLGADTERMTILGACNPSLAHQALQGEDAIGVLLPCSVFVRERAGGGSTVFLTRAEGLFSLIDNPAVAPIVAEVDTRMEAVAQGLRAAES